MQMSVMEKINACDTPSSETGVNEVTAILLVGGMGTRLRPVMPATPKPLAPIGSGSFLELLVRQLRHQGIRRLVMCTGYRSDQIENEFKRGDAWDVEIEYSRENVALGTAGAVKLAQSHLRNEPDFLVMNGDSFLDIDFNQLIRFHHEHKALATMAVLPVKTSARYGRVQMGTDGRVVGFSEKTGGDNPGLVSAGIYVFNRAVLEHISDGPASLETDVFPRLVNHGVYALEQRGLFIDIGTPEDYARAQDLYESLYGAALGAGTQFETSSHNLKSTNQGVRLENRVSKSIRESIAAKQRLLSSTDTVVTVAKVSEILINAFRNGNKVLLFGNGGSAADAQHIAAEFVGRFAFDRPALPALALSVNTSCVTAIGNDYAFDQVFSRQIEAMGRPGDVAIGISTSGNSPNIVRGLSVAKDLGLHTVALAGCTGGKLKNASVDHCICVPSKETPRIQECHILVGHIIAELVEEAMFHE